MAEDDRYETVCKHEFASLHKKVDSLLTRLYIDNGTESLQSKMNRMDIWISRATKIGIAAGLAVLGLCIDAVQEILRSIIH
jgi:hypothetical protein